MDRMTMNTTGTGSGFSAQNYAVISHVVTSSPSSIAAVVVTLLALSLMYQGRSTKNACFDMDGVPMKELQIDTRFLRFINPFEMSNQGKKLADDEPYLVRNGRHRELVLHSPEHVREFFRQDAKDHRKPKDLNFGDYFYRLLGQCVGMLHGEEWKAVRKHFDLAFTHDMGLRSVPSFEKEVADWLASIRNDSTRAGVGRTVVHAPTTCKILPFRLILLSLYGDAFNDEMFQRFVEVSKIQHEALMAGMLGRWQQSRVYNHLPTRTKGKLDRYLRSWQALNFEVLETAKKLRCPAVKIFEGVDPMNQMSMEEYLQTLDEILFTNIDITGGVLATILSSLAIHPEFQGSLYAEIRREKSQPSYEAATYIKRTDTLLHYLFLESLRLRPAVWFSVPECTAIDKVIGRYKVPAGTPVILDVRRVNTNPITWGVDGDQFRPERFADLSQNDYRYGFVKFGVGSGKCLGKHMAEVLLKLATIGVLEAYAVCPVEKNIGVKEGDLVFLER